MFVADKELTLKKGDKETIWIRGDIINAGIRRLNWILKKNLDDKDLIYKKDKSYPGITYIVTSDKASIYKEPNKKSKVINELEKYSLLDVIKVVKQVDKDSKETVSWLLDKREVGWVAKKHVRKHSFKNIVYVLQEHVGSYYNISERGYKKIKDMKRKYKNGKLTINDYDIKVMPIYGTKEKITLSSSDFHNSIPHEEAILGNGIITLADVLENNTISLKLYGFISKEPLPLPYEEGDKPLPKDRVVTIKFKIIGDKMLYNDKVFYKINLYQ